MWKVILARFIQILLSVLGLKIVTSYLSPANFAKYNLIISLIGFFVLFFISPVGHYLNRHLVEWKKSKVIWHHFKIFSAYIFLTSIFSYILINLDLKFTHMLSSDIVQNGHSLLVLFGIIVITLNQSFTASINILEFQNTFLLLTNITQALSIAIGLVFFKLGYVSAVSWTVAVLIGNFITSILAVAFLKGNLQSDVNVNNFKTKFSDVYNFSIPLFFITGITWFFTQGYRFYVENVLGLEQLGYFVAAYAVGSGIMAAFESVMVVYLQPKFYNNLSTSNLLDTWREYFKVLILPTTSLVFFIILLSDWFCKIFLSEMYSHVGTYIRWASIAEGLRVILNSIQLYEHGSKRTIRLIIPMIVGMIGAILFLYLKMNDLGLNAVGPAIVMGYFITILLSIIFNISFIYGINIKNKFLHILVQLLVTYVVFDERNQIQVMIIIVLSYVVYNVIILKRYLLES